MKKIQKKQSGRGGWRPNAGRKKGTSNRPQIRNYITEAEARELVVRAVKLARGGDPVLLKFLIEQYFGKAQQSVDLTTDGDKLTTVTVKILNGNQPASNEGVREEPSGDDETGGESRRDEKL